MFNIRVNWSIKFKSRNINLMNFLGFVLYFNLMRVERILRCMHILHF